MYSDAVEVNFGQKRCCNCIGVQFVSMPWNGLTVITKIMFYFARSNGGTFSGKKIKLQRSSTYVNLFCTVLGLC